MLSEVLDAVAAQPGDTVIDGTFGFGGYTEAILGQHPKGTGANVIALDRDPRVRLRADELVANYGERFRFIETAFSKMDQLDLDPVDAIVLDIGVSSMQIDQAERGFSFLREGPLDMRMGDSGPTAADAVNTLSREDLLALFRIYGEEKHARRATDAIIRAREEEVISTTDGLAKLIEDTLGRPPGPRGKIHPATRIFQALRIFVNDELGELSRAMCAAESLLKPGGRLVIVTFHSLEDRLVKRFLRDRSGEVESVSRYAPAPELTGPAATFTLLKRSAIKASKTEASRNPRARSAKLRAAIRTDAPAQACGDTDYPGVPHISVLGEGLAA